MKRGPNGNPLDSKPCTQCGKVMVRKDYLMFNRRQMCSAACMHASKRKYYDPESAAKHFWGRVDKLESGCWVHQGAKDKWGYAHFGIGGKRRQAHRYAYEISHGYIPTGKLILHSCDNPPCCNPAHLRIGTDKENRADC